VTLIKKQAATMCEGTEVELRAFLDFINRMWSASSIGHFRMEEILPVPSWPQNRYGRIRGYERYFFTA